MGNELDVFQMVLFICVKMKGAVDGIIGLKKEKKVFGTAALRTVTLNHSNWLKGFAAGSSNFTRHRFLEHLITMTFSSNPRAGNVENSGCRPK